MGNRILVVEDDPDYANLVEYYLVNGGFEVAAARNGKVALEYIANESFSLMITDLDMPGMGGLELIRKVREQFPEILIIVLSGFGETQAVIEAFRLGVHDFLNQTGGRRRVTRPCTSGPGKDSGRILEKSQRRTSGKSISIQKFIEFLKRGVTHPGKRKI